MKNQIEEVERGKVYNVITSNKIRREVVTLTFCHKDHTGTFQNGITNEGLLQVLIARYTFLVTKCDSQENIQTLLFLRQAMIAMQARTDQKIQQKDDHKRNSTSVQAASQQG